MEDTFTFVVSVILLLLLLVNWTATAVLFRASRQAQGSVVALKERARMAASLSLAATLNGILAVNRLLELHLGSFNVIIIISISLVLGSVPNLYWLLLYIRSRLQQ